MYPLRLRQTDLDHTYDNDHKQITVNAPNGVVNSTTESALAPAAPRPSVHYPKLPSISPAKPRLRKPGFTTTPSYTSSPITTTPNAGRKRANAISLSDTPARRSHSQQISRIFEKSRESLQFQDDVRKRSTEERRKVHKEADTTPVSPVQKWLDTLPVQTPRPNVGMLRSPSAKMYRLCASASSIAKRIQMRSPERFSSMGTPGELGKDTGCGTGETSLLSRLLQPAARPVRKGSGYSQGSTREQRLIRAAGSATSIDDDAPSYSPKTEEQEAIEQEDTASDSGSSDLHQTIDPSTPVPRTVTFADVKPLTPEVAVRRRGKGART